MLDNILILITTVTDPTEGADDVIDQSHACAAALVLAVTRADHEVKDSERRCALSAIARLLSIDEDAARPLVEEAEALLDDSVSLYDFTAIVHKEFDAERKRELLQLLWEVAFSDHVLDPEEELIVRKTAHLLHVPHEDFIDAKLAARRAHRDGADG